MSAFHHAGAAGRSCCLLWSWHLGRSRVRGSWLQRVDHEMPEAHLLVSVSASSGLSYSAEAGGWGGGWVKLPLPESPVAHPQVWSRLYRQWNAFPQGGRVDLSSGEGCRHVLHWWGSEQRPLGARACSSIRGPQFNGNNFLIIPQSSHWNLCLQRPTPRPQQFKKPCNTPSYTPFHDTPGVKFLLCEWTPQISGIFPH